MSNQAFDPTELIAPAEDIVRGWRNKVKITTADDKKMLITAGEGPMFDESESESNAVKVRVLGNDALRSLKRSLSLLLFLSRNEVSLVLFKCFLSSMKCSLLLTLFLLLPLIALIPIQMKLKMIKNL